MTALSLNSRVAKDASQVIDRIVDGDALLIQLESGEYYSLNSVGTQVWQSLDGDKTVRDLARAVESEYEVSMEQAQSDVLKLLQDLVAEKLVVLI